MKFEKVPQHRVFSAALKDVKNDISELPPPRFEAAVSKLSVTVRVNPRFRGIEGEAKILARCRSSEGSKGTARFTGVSVINSLISLSALAILRARV